MGAGARLTIQVFLLGELVPCDVVVFKPGGVLGHLVRFKENRLSRKYDPEGLGWGEKYICLVSFWPVDLPIHVASGAPSWELQSQSFYPAVWLGQANLSILSHLICLLKGLHWLRFWSSPSLIITLLHNFSSNWTGVWIQPGLEVRGGLTRVVELWDEPGWEEVSCSEGEEDQVMWLKEDSVRRPLWGENGL